MKQKPTFPSSTTLSFLVYKLSLHCYTLERDTVKKKKEKHFLLDTTWNSKVKKHRRWKKETLGSFFKMSMFYLNLPGADLCTQSMYMAWYWNYNSRMARNKKYKANFASQVRTVSWYMLTTVIYWSIGLHPHEIRLYFWKSGRKIKSALRDEYLLGHTFIMWLLQEVFCWKKVIGSIEKCIRGNWYLVTHINHAYKKESRFLSFKNIAWLIFLGVFICKMTYHRKLKTASQNFCLLNIKFIANKSFNPSFTMSG